MMVFERIQIWNDKVHVTVSRATRSGRYMSLNLVFPVDQLKSYPALEKEISEIADQERQRLAGKPAKNGRK